jgi:outer membrane immunogenic protein
MRRISLSGVGFLLAMITPVAAVAADMPVKAPAPPPPPPFSWTGFYIGGDIGGVWSNGNLTDSLHGLNVSTNHSGVIGGPEIGFNYQWANWVLGLEANFDWTSLSATGPGVVVPAVGTLQASANTKWVTTVAGRFGVTYNQLLFYGKAGVGWAGNNVTVTNLTTGGSVSASNTRPGWLLGAGVEWAFDPRWSAKIEYDYLGLRSWTFGSALFPGDTFNASRNIQMFTVGLNYRFGGDWSRY